MKQNTLFLIYHKRKVDWTCTLFKPWALHRYLNNLPKITDFPQLTIKQVHEGEWRLIPCLCQITVIMISSFWLVNNNHANPSSHNFNVVQCYLMVMMWYCNFTVFYFSHEYLCNHTTIVSNENLSYLYHPSRVTWMRYNFNVSRIFSVGNQSKLYHMLLHVWLLGCDFITWGLVVQSSHLHGVGGVGQQGVFHPTWVLIFG